MGIESDRLILDYLSKVGDLAQTAMAARERAQLVAKLRDDIDRQRHGTDSPAAVRKILGRLGTPDEVVGAAGRIPAQREPEPPAAAAWVPQARAPQVPAPAVPEPVAPEPVAPEPAVPEPAVPEPAVPEVPGPVNLDKQDETRPVEWWRTQPRRPLTLEEIAALPGVTIPLDKPEPEAEPEAAERPEAAEDAKEAAAPPSMRRLLRRRKPAPEAAAAPGPAQPPAPARPPAPAGRRRLGLGGLGGAFMETLAALALLAGAVLGSWPALLIGWLLAYYSRRLSPREAKFAALGLPGTVFLGTMVWLWGRMAGRWGEPIAQGQLGAELSAAFPWMVRVAAVGSALFVLWRSRRRTAG